MSERTQEERLALIRELYPTHDALKRRVRELEADIAAAKSKLWSTQDCHPNAIGTLAWEAYEILEHDSTSDAGGDAPR